MSNRRSGIDRRSGWVNWMTPIAERAIAAGMDEDRFLLTILSPKRPQVRQLFRKLVKERECAKRQEATV